MKISILTVEKSTPPGKKYIVAEVNYKNLTFNKVESKKVFSFGAQEQAFKVLADAKPGDVFEVEVKKNDAGYNDWIKMTQDAPGAVQGSGASSVVSGTPTRQWQGESAEERAKKQVLIVKQSTLAQAVATLCAGAKAPPKKEDVTDLAQYYLDWVFADKKVSLLDIPNDLPQDIQVE